MHDVLDQTDLQRLAEVLGARVTVVRRMGGGASNVTWSVRLGARAAVLRHPPRDRALLPTAHDVLREARVVRSLHGSGVPVPEVLAIGDDTAALGVPFAITELRSGSCLMIDTLPALDARALAHDAIDTLAAIHAIDQSTVALEARDGSYLERQIDLWQRQLQRTSTASRLGDLGPIHAWLRANRPRDERRTLVHGDYGFHNLLVERDRIETVLDWELCTFGDPLADVFSFLKSWGAGAIAPNPANDVVALASRAPSRDDLLARYGSITGVPVDLHARFYEVFGLWRSIGIFEGIHARSDATRFVDEPPQLVARAKGMMAAAPDPR